MIPTSRIYKFLDEKNNYAIAFLEGQKLIEEVVLLNQLNGQSLQFFRDAILCAAPMVSFLKNNEGMGIYIDSESPYFRLKIEAHSSGTIRTLLLPENIKPISGKITGECRLTKILPRQPYTSVLDVKNQSFEEIVNSVLKNSYQIESKLIVSQIADQSILITKLPDPQKTLKNEDRPQTLVDYEVLVKKEMNDIFSQGLTKEEEIFKNFKDKGFTYLMSSDIKFHCPCSKERMSANLISLPTEDLIELFTKENPIKVKCDYCKTEYEIFQNDVVPYGEQH